MQKNLTKRFFKHVKKTPKCWVWIGAKFRNGYGCFRFQGKSIGAHRISWRIFKGIIPKGFWILHHCDIKRCVRPNHLFIGTAIDNVKDMLKKGRNPRGESHYRTILRNEDIAEIKFLYKPGQGSVIGKIYGVSRRCVRDIVHGICWKHI